MGNWGFFPPRGALVRALKVFGGLSPLKGLCVSAVLKKPVCPTFGGIGGIIRAFLVPPIRGGSLAQKIVCAGCGVYGAPAC